MFKMFSDPDNGVWSLTSVNLALAGFNRFFTDPETILKTLATVGQLGVAAFTIYYIWRKARAVRIPEVKSKPKPKPPGRRRKNCSRRITAIAITVILMLSLAGCGTLIPKKVEFFQDKVEQVPEPNSREKEIQRQTALRARIKAEETVQAALSTDASPFVTVPAKETADLTEAVSLSVGPPLHPASADKASSDLANELRSAIAKLNKRMDDFKEDNNKNTGKKIEGTGLFQVPYFVWLGIVGVLIFVGFIVLAVLWSFVKMYAMSNPPVQLGVNAVQAGAGFLKRALSEVTSGGENFKNEVLKISNDPALQEKIKELFRSEHMKAQSADTQSIIGAMTAKTGE